MTEQREARYELADIVPGFVVIERELKSGATRAYFSPDEVPPKESYREGDQVWHYAEAAQSFRFSVRNTADGQVTRFDELLGLLYYGCLEPCAPLHVVGEMAHEIGISIYVAVAYAAPDGTPVQIAPAKLTLLNRAFNDRLRTPGKRILIVPDVFGIQGQVSHGQLMLDFGLTDMPRQAPTTPAADQRTE